VYILSVLKEKSSTYTNQVVEADQGCQIFLDTMNQNGGNMTKYQTAMK
jgi:hypothetical protein